MVFENFTISSLGHEHVGSDMLVYFTVKQYMLSYCQRLGINRDIFLDLKISEQIEDRCVFSR